MDWRDSVIDAYGRVGQVLERALDGLTPGDLNWQPHSDSNSMGWLTWHLTRAQDVRLSILMGKEQLYLSDRWYAKFNRTSDSQDRGFGHTSEEVAAFESPDVQILLDYYHAVLEQTRSYIRSLAEADLGEELNEDRQPVPTVGMRIVDILSDNLQHAGQVAYLRGLRKGKGWLDL